MGWIATGLCLPAFLVPYTFVFYPEILLRGELLPTLWTVFSASVGILFLAAGVFGYFRQKTNIWERLLFIAGGLLLFDPGLFTDIIGFIFISIGYLSQRSRRAAPLPGSNRKVQS